MGNPVINYSKQVYLNKITELEGYGTRLKGHLATLEGLRDRVRTVWDDDAGQEYYDLLSKQIIAVRNANDRIDSLRGIYQEAIGDMTKAGTLIGGDLDDAKSIISMLNIEGA